MFFFCSGGGGGEGEGGTRLVDGCDFVHGEELGDNGDFFADVGVRVLDEGLDNGAEVGVGTDPGDYKKLLKSIKMKYPFPRSINKTKS